VKAMSVGGRDERFAVSLRNLHGTPVWIEEAAPKMAKLNRIETVDFFHQFLPHRAAKNIEWMRRDGE
jgi:hypothetical protein